jgi:Holliday junction resolvase RusA-like endonuclease
LKNTIIIDQIPTLLNKLYQPICKNGKPSLIKNKEAKEFQKMIQFKLGKKYHKLKGDISFKCDIDISKRRDYDIDAVLKLLLDTLQGICYEDDKQIVDLRVRKHRGQDNDRLIVLIEEIN